MSIPLDSYWPLVEPLFDLVSTDDPATFTETTRNVRHDTLLLFTCHFCLSEVWNGGLLQYFWNSTGLLAPEAIEGFQFIGMPRLASVLSAAASSLGDIYPRDRADRWDAMLVNSGFSEAELAHTFETAANQYLAFQKATQSYGWDEKTKEIYSLAKQENGGFQIAATSFANQSIAL